MIEFILKKPALSRAPVFSVSNGNELKARLSFAQAAKALAMPPATLSRRVMQMEKRAGLRLFDRTTRSVSPTQTGLLLATHAARMLAEVEASELSLSTMRDEAVGVVRITTPTIFGQALLGPVVSTFLKDFQKCHLEVELLDRYVNVLDEGHDAAIRVGGVVDESPIAKPLGVVQASLYRGTEHPDVGLEDLPHVPICALHKFDWSNPTLVIGSKSGERRTVRIQARLGCRNPWLLRHMALGSDVVAVLPDIVAASEVEAGRLKRVLPGWYTRHVPVSLVYTSDRLMRPAVRAFLDTALAVIPRLIAEPHRMAEAAIEAETAPK